MIANSAEDIMATAGTIVSRPLQQDLVSAATDYFPTRLQELLASNSGKEEKHLSKDEKKYQKQQRKKEKKHGSRDSGSEDDSDDDYSDESSDEKKYKKAQKKKVKQQKYRKDS